ncbi:MAG TPA: cysteine hydrolase [Verrucomicrobiae bacterium]|nr:cysteine hydrolase [Verrucomicrobiae bacterium]
MKAIQTFASVLLLIAVGCGTTGQRHSIEHHAPATRLVTIPAQPRPLEINLRKTAVIVVDMQNDFVTKGGLLDRVGIEVAGIQKIVPRIRETLELARKAGLTIVYLKMGYRPDLSDIGSEDSPMGVENRRAHVGEKMCAPDGREGRFLVRDTWNTDIVDELRPQSGDIIVYKTRYSGFYNTELDAILKRRGMRTLMMMGCTTSVCVESTLRDAMFRDYSPVLLSDCTAEPIGQEFPRSNHEASLFLIREAPFGAVATSADFAKALEGLKQ